MGDREELLMLGTSLTPDQCRAVAECLHKLGVERVSFTVVQEDRIVTMWRAPSEES